MDPDAVLAMLKNVLREGHEANPSDRGSYPNRYSRSEEGGALLFNLSGNPWEFATPILAHGNSLSDAWEEAMEWARDEVNRNPESPFRHYVTEDPSVAASWVGVSTEELQKAFEEGDLSPLELDFHGGSGLIFCSRYWEFLSVNPEQLILAGFPSCPICGGILYDYSRSLTEDLEPLGCSSCNETFPRGVRA